MAAAKPWPNGLGYDIGDTEVWKHKDCFRVFTPTLVMLIPYWFTDDPVVAADICKRQGFRRDELAEMELHEADRILHERVPVPGSVRFNPPRLNV